MIEGLGEPRIVESAGCRERRSGGEGLVHGELQLAVLGKAEIRKDGQTLSADLISAKGQALLIYLAVTGEAH